MDKFGNKLKEIREEFGLTLNAASQITGIAKGYLWDLENKADPNPTIKIILKIAKSLNVSILYLINDDCTDMGKYDAGI